MDINSIRKDFPILNRNFIYLDSAATSQKPRQVIDAIRNYYENYNANVHRSIYSLASEATEIYESSRKNIADFIGARDNEIIFTRNTTEALNLLSYSLQSKLEKGDEVLLSRMEHHSNLLPWLRLESHGIKVKFIELDSEGNMDEEDFKSKLTKNVKLVSITHVSNVLGTINNIEFFGKMAKENESLFVVDGAQSVPHLPFKINDYIDFLAFSGHKMLGPMGIGVLYGKYSLLEGLPPFMQGGEMVKSVSLERVIYEDPPVKFEAGTPNVEGAVGLSAAVDYLKKIGMDNIRKHEYELGKRALELAESNKLIEYYGPRDSRKRSGLISFNLKSKKYDRIVKDLQSKSIIAGKLIHSHDVAEFLGDKSVFARSGYHCAEPLFKYLGINGSVRFSWYLYNTIQEIEKAFESLGEINV